MRAVAIAGAFGATAMAAPAAHAAANPTVNPGDIVISEFRLHGPNGANDEFFELFNTTNHSLDLNDDEGNSVFWIEYWAPTPPPAGAVQLVTPIGTDVGGRHHYLFANEPDAVGTQGYSLSGYQTADVETDVSAVGDVPFDGGIALMYDPNALDSSCADCIVVDRAGFPNGTGGGVNYFEGVPEPAFASAQTSQQYSHVRKYTSTGLYTDTGSNSPDFNLVVTDNVTSYGGVPSIQGAPGPQGRVSPLIENDAATPNVAGNGINSALFNPSVSSTAFPNREYVAPSGCSGSPVVCTTPGVLTIRRRVTNNTGSDVTELRFRITQLTTWGTSTATQALLRATDTNTATVSGEPALGAKVEEPPNQPDGGGLNTSMFVNLTEDSGLSGGVLPNGGNVVVTFRFLVDRGGGYAFSYNSEGA